MNSATKKVSTETPPQVYPISTINKLSFSYNSINEDLNDIDECYSNINTGSKDNLFRNIRGFLIFGRCIGILPYQGVFGCTSEALKFRWIRIPSIISYIILSVSTLNVILELIRSLTASKKNAFEVAQSVRSTLYNVWGAVIYLNFIARSKPFLSIFNTWRATKVFYFKEDRRLKRDVIIVTVIIFVSAILENSVLHMNFIREMIQLSNDGERMSVDIFLEKYYCRFHANWARYLSYNSFFAVLAFVQHKCILFAWNYMDVMIALLGRALYYKFKALCDVANKALVKPLKEKSRFANNPQEAMPLNQSGWTQLVRDHRALCDLLKAFENFLSPLIFASYMINIYYICMQLVEGLTVEATRHSIIHAIYAPWSFIHLIMRAYIVSIYCARVNVYAHQIGSVIEKCPAECYSTDVSRLDKRVNGGRDIGLTGLGGCFTVSKPFILTTIGVIFTFEIVLLQVIPTTSNNGSCCCPLS